MFNIYIIATGKLKESYWKDAAEEYIKRLTPYAKIHTIELPEEKFRSQAEKERVMQREAEVIQKHIPKNAVLVALDERGKKYSSTELAKFLAGLTEHGETIVFVIGGPLGLHESIRNKARVVLSLSELTFTHQLCRVILLEQLYRSITIIKGKAYHY